MSQLVECVPNFSEGNNQEVIDAISRAVAQTPGCVLLDVDAGPSTNRTVYTFVGQPKDVVEGALNAARAAFRLIDMSQHKGEHPRMGALDVCPFIPVRGVTMDECVLCAQAFGQRLAEELGVPVYLYGEAAQTAGRRALPAIRAGEYEALPEKLKQAEWAPDFGPSTFVPSWGATVTGARKFLIAFNVNLLSTKEQAHRIALNLREQGRGKDQPGRLKKVQGIGWYLDEKNLAQVSTNLLDFEVTALHTVYEEACREAQELSLPVVGSQLVGLVPLKALLDAAAFYCKKENLFVLEEEHRIRLVVNRLGLDSLAPFNPKERIIEYLVPDRGPERSLVDEPLGAFVREVGARSAAPGGGSVAAASAAMGAPLRTHSGAPEACSHSAPTPGPLRPAATPHPLWGPRGLQPLRTHPGAPEAHSWPGTHPGAPEARSWPNAQAHRPWRKASGGVSQEDVWVTEPSASLIGVSRPSCWHWGHCCVNTSGVCPWALGAACGNDPQGLLPKVAVLLTLKAAAKWPLGGCTDGAPPERSEGSSLDPAIGLAVTRGLSLELPWCALLSVGSQERFPNEATKLPKNTPEERERRAAALQEGLRQAVAVPLALAEKVTSLWPALQELAQCGNVACRSDLQVAAKALETGVFGAYFNVLVNLKGITDSVFKEQTHQHICSLLQEAKTQAALVLDCLAARQE
ncbi:formimidoyltransferase-cyclodeaminase [Suricata suricatta]|uniref:formimidoyltransferase-cyclodeaminase n=1 Tax=Suricata suricatta TaxID=37032 RepID=UPI001155C86F|nr:formimidoyltransferase-cyclodeaminase [Suricata suricatta]